MNQPVQQHDRGQQKIARDWSKRSVVKATQKAIFGWLCMGGVPKSL